MEINKKKTTSFFFQYNNGHNVRLYPFAEVSGVLFGSSLFEYAGQRVYPR